MTTLRQIINYIEHNIGKHSIHNHEYHSKVMIPELINQISNIPITKYGSFMFMDQLRDKTHDNTGIIWSDIYLCKDKKYCINLMALFKNTKMAIHDHPNINGLNYVLNGKIYHQTFDILSCTNIAECIYSAKRNPSKIFEKNETFITTHIHDNTHTFTALQDSIILGILIPDFDHIDRIQSFYQLHSENSTENVELKRIESLDCYDINIEFDGNLD